MIISRYIFKQTLSSVFTSTLVFISVIWLSQSFKIIKLIIDKGANVSDFLILSAYSFPHWLILALPFGTFSGCMISYFKLENDREIVVMKSSGMNAISISAPALLISLISSIILLVNVHFVLPSSYNSFKILQNKIRNNPESLKIKDNIFVNLNNNQTIFINKLNINGYFEEIFIQDTKDSRKVIELFAKNGFIKHDNNQLIIYMKKGTRISTNKQNISTILDFNNYNLLIMPERNKSKGPRVIEYNEYSFFELINKAKGSKSNKGKLLAEAHNRYTICLLPIIYTLIVMILILNGYYTRKPSIYRKIISVGLLVLIQILVILIKNSAHFNIGLISLMYLFPFGLIIFGFIILYKNLNIDKVKYILTFGFFRKLNNDKI